jgi:hypothetical protein
METRCQITNTDTTFELLQLHHHLEDNTMPSPQYNVDEEFFECLELMYDILDFLSDIKLALELDEDLGPIIHPPFIPRPPFDPFLTIY